MGIERIKKGEYLNYIEFIKYKMGNSLKEKRIKKAYLYFNLIFLLLYMGTILFVYFVKYIPRIITATHIIASILAYINIILLIFFIRKGDWNYATFSLLFISTLLLRFFYYIEKYFLIGWGSILLIYIITLWVWAKITTNTEPTKGSSLGRFILKSFAIILTIYGFVGVIGLSGGFVYMNLHGISYIESQLSMMSEAMNTAASSASHAAMATEEITKPLGTTISGLKFINFLTLGLCCRKTISSLEKIAQQSHETSANLQEMGNNLRNSAKTLDQMSAHIRLIINILLGFLLIIHLLFLGVGLSLIFLTRFR